MAENTTQLEVEHMHANIVAVEQCMKKQHECCKNSWHGVGMGE